MSESPYKEIVPFQSMTEVEERAEATRRATATAIAHASMKALEVVLELLEDPDPNIRARAADLVWSRSIPKIAAKHVQNDGDIIESVDKIALRESIEELMKRDR
jgi:HEAT repeat protein